MRQETIAFFLAVVVPPILLHFSLLTYASVVNALGEPPRNLAHWRRPAVLLLDILAILWGAAGYILAWPVSYRLIEEVIIRVITVCGFLTHEQTFNGIQGPAYLLLWLWTNYVMDRMALRKVPLDYFMILQAWLPGAIIYWTVVGGGIYFTIMHYFPHNC